MSNAKANSSTASLQKLNAELSMQLKTIHDFNKNLTENMRKQTASQLAQIHKLEETERKRKAAASKLDHSYYKLQEENPYGGLNSSSISKT